MPAYALHHQYPTIQTMRHCDRPQTPVTRPVQAPDGARGHEDGIGEHNMPPVYVQDFQDQYRSAQTPFRGRAKSTTSTGTGVGDADTAPPLPDIHQRSIHVPTRTR